MRISIEAMKVVSVVSLVACAGGCGATPDTGSSTGSDGETPEVSQEAQPIASLTLANGNVVSFYDAEGGALITELGNGNTTSTLKDLPREFTGTELVAAWQKLAPDLAVPPELDALQLRLTQAEPPAELREHLGPAIEQGGAFGRPGTGSAQGGGLQGEAAEAPLASCGNVCCDVGWLQANFWECSPQGGSGFSWNNFNFGWSVIQQPNDAVYWTQAVTCAAQGQSQWSAAWRNGGFSVGVQQGYWLQHVFYTNSGWFGPIPTWFNYYVNSQAQQRWHSFCGYLSYSP